MVERKREYKTAGFSGRLRVDDKKRLQEILKERDISLPDFIVQSTGLYKVVNEWGSKEVHFMDKVIYIQKILENQDIVKYLKS
jgi:hypothetical protein